MHTRPIFELSIALVCLRYNDKSILVWRFKEGILHRYLDIYICLAILLCLCNQKESCHVMFVNAPESFPLCHWHCCLCGSSFRRHFGLDVDVAVTVDVELRMAA